MSEERRRPLNGLDMLVDELRMVHPDASFEVLRGGTYQDKRTIIAIPTRGGPHPVDIRVVASWLTLAQPQYSKIAWFFDEGDEVAHAYNNLVAHALLPATAHWPFLLTLEDDNLVPRDAHLRLLARMHELPGAAAVSGLYYSKGRPPLPYLCGEPARFTGEGPEDVGLQRLAPDPRGLQEVNAVTMGCTLWRLDLFRRLQSAPFRSGHSLGFELDFCQRMKLAAGARFYVDTTLRVGHLDTETGEVF